MIIRPFVVEFTGTPEAGKTTTLQQILPLLEALPYIRHDGVCYIGESAEIAPAYIPKGSFDANFWMRAYMIAELLKQVYNSSNDIILIDRGIIDAQFFGYKFYIQKLCSIDEFKSYNSLINNKSLLPDLIIHLTTTPKEAVRRRGGEGRIVTLDWIKSYNLLFEQFLSSISSPIFSMDTTNVPQDIVVKAITSIIVGDYETFLNKR